MSATSIPPPDVDIVLHQDPYPQDVGNWQKIAADSCFCPVCCNLFAGSAYAILPREDIHMHDCTGLKNAMAFKAKAHEDGNDYDTDEIDHVPEWAGAYRADYASWQFTASSTDMEAQAEENNCSSCWILLNGIIRLNDASPPQLKIEVGLGFEAEVVFCKGNVLRVQVHPLKETTTDSVFGTGTSPDHTFESTPMACEFYTLPGEPCPWPTIGPCMALEDPLDRGETWRGSSTRHIEAHPNENDYLQIIEKWLMHCTKDHPLCSQELERNNYGSLPKRVIDVGPDDNSGIHIVEHDEETSPMNGRYNVLSHCWGLTQHILSEKGNIDVWKENIPWHKLQRTFREAITLTRQLGIRYLWIDSLCIIQDDSEDWEIEAAKMGLIYNNAYLVIAATGSVDGDGGIFIDKAPYVTLRGEDQHRKPFQIYVRRGLGHGSFGWGVNHFQTTRATRYVYTSTTNPGYPLFTRAWCFQERLLGSRVVHFTRDELIFECITSVSCACGALADFSNDWVLPSRRFASSRHSPDPSGHLPEHESTLGKLPKLAIETSFADGFSHFEEWRDVVSEYSEKQITHPTDWLPAIAGLAIKWEGPEMGYYLAGLWSKDLLRGLLWESLASGRTEMPAYIAPSWSWASIQGSVTWITRFSRSEYYVEIDLQRTACIPKGLNKLGELATGWLFLTGPVIEGTLISLEDEGSEARRQRAFVEVNNSKCTFNVDSRSCCSKLIGQKILCLRYCTDMSSDSSTRYHRRLILARVPEEEDLPNLPGIIKNSPSLYRRIGVEMFCPVDQWQSNMRYTVRSIYII